MSRCLCTSWILIEIYCLWTGDRNQISSPPPDLISIDLSLDDDVTGGWWYVVNIGLCLNNICLIVLSVMCRHIPTHFQMYFCLFLLILYYLSSVIAIRYVPWQKPQTQSVNIVPVLRSAPDVAQLANPVLRAAANQSSVSCYFACVSLLFYFVFMNTIKFDMLFAVQVVDNLKKIWLKGVSFVHTSVFVWTLGSLVSIYLAHSVHSSLLISETWQV